MEPQTSFLMLMLPVLASSVPIPRTFNPENGADLASSVPSLGPFNPKKSADEQPETFLPSPLNHDCSVYIPGTVWHYIDHISGRCCRQIFVTNGTFEMCGRNGGWDKLVACPNGFYNRKSPFYTGQFLYDIDAKTFCKDKGPVEGLAFLNISWSGEKYVISEGTPSILYGTVYSNSKLVKAYLFRNDDVLPLGNMSYGQMDGTDEWYAQYTLRKPVLEDSGVYRILVINTRNSAWSRNIPLTVLPRATRILKTTTSPPTQSPTTQANDSPDTTQVNRPAQHRPSQTFTPMASQGVSGYGASFTSLFVCLGVTICVSIWKSRCFGKRWWKGNCLKSL